MVSDDWIDRRIVLDRRPVGAPALSDFRIAEPPVRELRPGELRLRTVYASIDPAMRVRMQDAKSYLPPYRIGGVIGTYAIGQVIETQTPDFAVGDWAWSYSGWQLHPVLPASAVFRIEPAGLPLSSYLGVLGLTGFTAWVGLQDIGRPQPGETVLVTAASGAVGSVAGQLAVRAGCRVVGVTSGAERGAMLTGEYGFHAALDRNADDFAERLDAACPDGIDVFFDNSGGFIQQLALPRMNVRGRVILCGMIAEYNDAAPPPGPNLMAAVKARLRIEGLLASDSIDRLPQYQAMAGEWVRAGELKARETVAAGLEAAPGAFIDLLQGDKLGKSSVQLAPDPFAPERDAALRGQATEDVL